MQQLSFFQNDVSFPHNYCDIEALYRKYVYEGETDADAFTWSELKKGRSYAFYGKKVMTFIPSETGNAKLKISLTSGEVVTLDESATSSDLLLHWLDKLRCDKKIIFRNLITEEFGCCNDFMRCSAVDKCIHQEDRFYNGCYYRRNLENGRNFYKESLNSNSENHFKYVIGLDFETANASRSSACAVAAVKYDCKGEVTDRYCTLINPHEPFDPFNVMIHGIDESMVIGSPEIAEAMAGVFKLIDSDSIVVCHNAAFDMSVLRNALEKNPIQIPDFTFTCTYRLASRVLPKNVSYSLPDVAEQCGLTGLIHHDAESDAATCAQILLYLIKMFDGDIDKLHITANIKYGFFKNGEYEGIHKSVRESLPENRVRHKNLPSFSIGPESPFYQKQVAFTGKLESMTRAEAIDIINTIGGYGSDKLNKQTDYLITGYQNPAVLAEGKSKSGKYLAAEKMLSEGKNIEIIPEDMFIKML